MTSKRKKKETLATLGRELLRAEDNADALKELLEGTDRSAALVASALVDTTLVRALAANFVLAGEKDLETIFYNAGAPLSSFSARIEIGRAIGIYASNVYEILNVLRRVRNVFAHSVRPISFSHPLVSAACESLPKVTLSQALSSFPENIHPLRERYTSTCLQVQVVLNDHADRYFSKPKYVDIPNA